MEEKGREGEKAEQVVVMAETHRGQLQSPRPGDLGL